MNFRDQSNVFLASLRTRKSRQTKPSTLVQFEGFINNWILPLIGDEEIENFGNSALKAFAGKLGDLSPATTHAVVRVVRHIVASAVDQNGDLMYPRQWNWKFIDLPPVGDQKQPVVTTGQLNKAVSINERYRLLYAILAGTGLRIGEALAIRTGDDGVHTAWDPQKAAIFVRTAFWRGMEQSPKTKAGIRVVDLEPSLNLALMQDGVYEGEFLFRTSLGARMWPSYIRDESLKSLGIQGFHSFRRFRITHLAGAGVPRDLIEYWAGHALPGLAAHYTKFAEGERIRKEWAQKAGLGFEVHA